MIFVTVKGRPIGFKRTTHRQKFVDKSYHKYRDYKPRPPAAGSVGCVPM